MMLVKNLYINKYEKAKRFKDLTPVEIELSIENTEKEKPDPNAIFLAPEPEVYAMRLKLGRWRPIMDCMVEVLIEDFK